VFKTHLKIYICFRDYKPIETSNKQPITMKKNRLIALSALALTMPVGLLIMAMTAPENAVPERPEGTCDIYAKGGTPRLIALHALYIKLTMARFTR
jgi:hypothetical protein